MLCDDLEVWEGGWGGCEGGSRGREKYVYLWLIHVVIWQK